MRHIRQKKHYGPGFKFDGSIPEGVVECLGPDCQFCLKDDEPPS